MRDAIGGSVVLTIIVVFIVVVSAYLAFNVNYTKAFRMKNKIISLYEEYKGECYKDTRCEQKIAEYADSLGYKPNLNCGSYKTAKSRLYCYKTICSTGEPNTVNEGKKFKQYYKIQTKIDIRIPIIDNIMGLQVFTISGDTKTFDVDVCEK